MPAVFSHVPFADQSPAVQLLLKALQRQQLSHAYLFKGALSAGLLLAKVLAQALFCPQGGCADCHICQQTFVGQHPDWHLIQAAEDSRSQLIKLEQIHQLIRAVSLPPHQASHQIFVIVQAENLPKASSNALLKTLEEPASNSIIVLLTSQLSRILPTIRSRTQILYLPQTAERVLADNFWSWEQLEAIQSPAQLPTLRAHLESLSAEELAQQLQSFQRECWSKIRGFIVNKHSLKGLQRAQAYLQLFEESLAQLQLNAHKDMLRESFALRYLQLRQGVSQRPNSVASPQKGFS